MSYNAPTRIRCITAQNVNQTNTDLGTFTGLPAKYRVLRFQAYDASTSLTTATCGLFTASAGGGTAIVTGQALSPLTAATKFADLALAVTADYQTAATLTARVQTAQGSAATCSFLVEILELK